MKWRVRLRGHQFDLQSLAEIFREGDRVVSMDAEANYVLESSTLDPFDEATEVSAEAERLLTMMNGASKALDASHRLVQLAGHFRTSRVSTPSWSGTRCPSGRGSMRAS